MGATKSSRLRTRGALFVVVGLLLAAGVQCLLLAGGHGPVVTGHHFASPAQAVAHYTQIGHAHIEAAAHHMKPDLHVTMIRPRAEHPLRLLGAVTVAAVLAVLALFSAALRSRGPPSPAHTRTGRTILRELCVIRC